MSELIQLQQKELLTSKVEQLQNNLAAKTGDLIQRMTTKEGLLSVGATIVGYNMMANPDEVSQLLQTSIQAGGDIINSGAIPDIVNSLNYAWGEGGAEAILGFLNSPSDMLVNLGGAALALRQQFGPMRVRQETMLLRTTAEGDGIPEGEYTTLRYSNGRNREVAFFGGNFEDGEDANSRVDRAALITRTTGAEDAVDADTDPSRGKVLMVAKNPKGSSGKPRTKKVTHRFRIGGTKTWDKPVSKRTYFDWEWNHPVDTAAPKGDWIIMAPKAQMNKIAGEIGSTTDEKAAATNNICNDYISDVAEKPEPQTKFIFRKHYTKIEQDARGAKTPKDSFYDIEMDLVELQAHQFERVVTKGKQGGVKQECLLPPVEFLEEQLTEKLAPKTNTLRYAAGRAIEKFGQRIMNK